MCLELRNSESCQGPQKALIIIIQFNSLLFMCRVNGHNNNNNSIQFNSLLFVCRVNSHKDNYRHSTVQIYITT
jgi:hypothetical protein